MVVWVRAIFEADAEIRLMSPTFATLDIVCWRASGAVAGERRSDWRKLRSSRDVAVGNAEAWWGAHSQQRPTGPPSREFLRHERSGGQRKPNTHPTHTPTHAPKHTNTRDPDRVYLRTVTVVSLQTLLAGEGMVDRLQFDCQGQDLVVLKLALQVGCFLDNVKKALHRQTLVGTHSPVIEVQIFGMLFKARWHLVALHLFKRRRGFRFRQFNPNGGDGIQVRLNLGSVDIRSELDAERKLVGGCEAMPHHWPPLTTV
jgi:hypothetical protein